MEFDRSGAAAIKAWKQIDIRWAASGSEREEGCSSDGIRNLLAVGDWMFWIDGGSVKRLDAANHRLWKTTVGATLVNRSMQYHSVCESIRPPLSLRNDV